MARVKVSKGWGNIQKTIVTSLSRYPHQSISELGCKVYDVEIPSASQYAAISRALNKLAAAGVVEKSGLHSEKGHQCWTLTGARLANKAARAKAQKKPRLQLALPR